MPTRKSNYEILTLCRKKKKSKPFVCFVCGKYFNQSGNLKTHQRIHSNDHPFACSLCPYKAKNHCNLRNHTRARHSDERPYKCSTCNACFNDHSAWRYHMDLHDVSKKYSCPHCPSSYKQKPSLARHLRHRHLSAGTVGQPTIILESGGYLSAGLSGEHSNDTTDYPLVGEAEADYLNQFVEDACFQFPDSSNDHHGPPSHPLSTGHQDGNESGTGSLSELAEICVSTSAFPIFSSANRSSTSNHHQLHTPSSTPQHPNSSRPSNHLENNKTKSSVCLCASVRQSSLLKTASCPPLSLCSLKVIPPPPPPTLPAEPSSPSSSEATYVIFSTKTKESIMVPTVIPFKVYESPTLPS